MCEPEPYVNIENSEELGRPCPFCGSSSLVAVLIHGGEAHVSCRKCGCAGPKYKYVDSDVNMLTNAAGLWNTRVRRV